MMQTKFPLLLLAALVYGSPIARAEFKCSCTPNGDAHCVLDGERFPINCGAKTPNKGGQLPKMERCKGTSFKCMKGKECITISGPYKFHMTNCGSGGSQPTGSMRGAGCVNVPDHIMDKLVKLIGKPFKVDGPGKSGR